MNPRSSGRTPGGLSLRLIVLALSATVGVTSAALPQTITVHVGSRAIGLSSFIEHGVQYASITMLALRMKYRTFSDEEKGKFEVTIGEQRLKFTADNPFVVLLKRGSNTVDRVWQLGADMKRIRSEFYVPLPVFLPLFNAVSPQPLMLSNASPALSGHTTEQTVENGRTTERAVVAPDVETVFDVSALGVDTRKNGTLVRIHGRKNFTGYSSAKDGEGAFVVTMPNTTMDAEEIERTSFEGTDIHGVRATQQGKDAMLTFTLDEGVTADGLSEDTKTGDLVVSVYRTAEVRKIFDEEQQDKKSGKRTKWKLDCIVIDAGHGGKDPGAIGTTGVREKNVTLGIALKLGALIKENMKGVKVVYTRKDDTFIELDRRGQIANNSNGKLFISIHCNSTEQKPTPANGFEVYLLRPGRTEEAIRIAEFENSVIKMETNYEKRYAKMKNENFIITTMAQNAYVKYSEQFAEYLHKEVKASNTVKSKGVKQAGFYVLVGASMPSVLIESAFLSNKKEEALLRSADGQAALADLVFAAIEKYSAAYEKSLKR